MHNFKPPSPVLSLDLVAVGEEDAKFQYHLRPTAPIVTTERSGLTFELGVARQIHGTLSPTGKPATVIALSCNFFCSKPGRRFKDATITLFFAEKPNTPRDKYFIDDFKIVDISPCGDFTINPTPRTIDQTTACGATAGADSILGLIKLEGKASHERKDTLTVIDKGKFLGKILWEPKGGVEFSLHENPKQHDGLPSQLRVVILMERNSTQESLKLSAYIDLHTGWWEDKVEQIQRYFQGTPQSQPKVIEPARRRDDGDKGIEPAELEKMDLDRLSFLLSTTVLENLVRTQTLGVARSTTSL